ncbi:uncharacterized protein LOC100907984 [Galendromus occidentalis]|uniref:Uncharacterized protein LOC100907984 n=1 Tax=Galendromus occidentalis TaxID=34638 RepID=A0AAJ6QS82_9ACAR|nr:uncharacterized protein LOC100907984 [Galendromus occidentalis]
MKNLIIDTDCGVDDAIALIAALSSGNANVVAITCVSGNASLRDVLVNVSKVLKTCGREGVPFYAGCEGPLARENVFANNYHGTDGLGECPSEFEKGPEAQPGIHAAEALIKTSKDRVGEIVLVMLGPCTNLAVAHHIDPRVTTYFKEIICMGGNIEGKGNVTPGAEFNFASDPEAAHVLVQQSKCPVLLVPWETITKNWIPWNLYERMINGTTPKSKFLKAICAFTEKYYRDENVGHDGYELGDFLAVLAAIRPDSVTKKISRRLAVELRGEHTSGQVVQAWYNDMLPAVTKSTAVALEFDPRIVEETLRSMVGDP